MERRRREQRAGGAQLAPPPPLHGSGHGTNAPPECVKACMCRYAARRLAASPGGFFVVGLFVGDFCQISLYFNKGKPPRRQFRRALLASQRWERVTSEPGTNERNCVTKRPTHRRTLRAG